MTRINATATRPKRGQGRIRRALHGAVLLAALAVALPGTARAADESTVLRLRAESLAASGDCETAVPLLERVRAANSADGRAALLLGKCQIQRKRYGEAVAALDAAMALPPVAPETELYLGMARFHQGDLTGAEEAFEAASRATPNRPEVDLYLGVLALNRAEQLLQTAEREQGRAENTRARSLLERARLADPTALDPMASYYEALSAEAAGDRADALARLRRVRDEHPGTEWAAEADTRLRSSQDSRPDKWWVEATLGFEYDDNVVLRGSGTALPREISSQNDHRGVWSIEAGYELFRNADWTVGLLATYYGTVHDDLQDFNVQFPGISGWVDRRLSERQTARFQYDFGYAWVGGSEPFLAVHTWTPAFYQNWGRPGLTRFFAAFDKRNYLFGNFDTPDGRGVAGSRCLSRSTLFCGPPGVDESRARNRDGWGFTLGFDHTLPLTAGLGPRESDANPAPGERNARFFLRGGYRYHRYSARGTEYSYQGHEVRGGFRVLLPYAFSFETMASYQYRPYRNRSTFPDPEDVAFNREYPLSGKDRHDDLFGVEVILERPITDSLTLSARYAYYDDASNVDVFDYNREVIGIYATYRFSP